MDKNMSLPASVLLYAEEDPSNGDLFLKMRIRVMHTGLNKKRINFSYNSTVDAISRLTIPIPILCYIGENEWGDIDFRNHEIEYMLTEDGVKTKYLGVPIGSIPDNTSATIVDEDGRQYVELDAYIWKLYANEALDIIYRDYHKKVSMEIKIRDFVYKDDDIIDILKYDFTGVVLLGEDITPVMHDTYASIETFSMSNSFMEMANELKKHLGGGVQMEDNKIKEEEVKEEEVKEEETKEEEVKEEETKVEENKVEETKTEENNVEQTEVDNTELFALQEQNTKLEEQINLLQAQLTKQETEVKAEKVTELFALFEDVKEVDGYKELVEKKDALEYEELELRLFALRGKNIQPKKEDENTDISLFAFKDKHTDNKPAWASLVDKHTKGVE